MPTLWLCRPLFLFLNNVMIGYSQAVSNDTNPSTGQKFLEEGEEI